MLMKPSMIIESLLNIQKIEKQAEIRPYYYNNWYMPSKIQTGNNLHRHLELVKAKALRALGRFNYAKRFLRASDLQKMYKGIVEPYFN